MTGEVNDLKIGLDTKLTRSTNYYTRQDSDNKLTNYYTKQESDTTIENVSIMQVLRYPNWNADLRFFKLGRLTLPNGGHHATITVNACHGWNVNAGLINSKDYNISNYQMTAHIHSSTSSSSRAVFPGCFPSEKK